MKYFLSPERRNDLVKSLVKLGMPEASAIRFSQLEDNMKEVDIALLSHAQCLVHFRERQDVKPDSRNLLAVAQGGLIMASLMEEAQSRGLGENDFPISLVYIKSAVTAKRK